MVERETQHTTKHNIRNLTYDKHLVYVVLFMSVQHW